MSDVEPTRKKWRLVCVLTCVVALICVAGFGMMLYNLYQSLSANASMIGGIKETVEQMKNDPCKEEKLGLLIDHMRELQDIQSRSLSNDLMSFIYGVLSTVLIGVCANYVAKCEIRAKEVLEVREQLEIENRKMQNNLKLLQIQPAISEAKLALFSRDMILANDCCQIRISQAVSSMVDLSKSAPYNFDKSSVEGLREELALLRVQIERFDRRIEREKRNNAITEDDYNSKHKTAFNCKTWISDSITACNDILKRI